MQSKIEWLKNKFFYFFLQPASLNPLVFLRISFAFLCLCLWLNLYPSLHVLFGKQGYIEWFISEYFFSNDSIPTLSQATALGRKMFHLSDEQFVKYLYCTYGACLFMIGLGLFSNFFAFLAWLIHLVFFNTNVIYAYGLESILHVILFYLIFMPVDARYSLSSIIFKKFWGRKRETLQIKARIFLRLLQLHLCIIYLDAGLSKLFGTHWLNGEGVWRSLTQFPFNPYNLGFIAHFPQLVTLAGWFVLAVEVLYPLLVWHTPGKKYILASILFLHGCISFLMGLYFFGFIMIIFNLAAFIIPSKLKQ